ncbi:hypothetical protein BCR34DRAFT_563920 [Clohesyomyces aquaticus]|uniref:Uncharacterized protein n=1 Tax=Clohesyomyces aquaticus TaxID=1231657 RepID=A0A1Y1ZRA3_9PLEO|nr:hypothetical protein BCR34DRAFT_563920 [Clohesyomyces aquaticus]
MRSIASHLILFLQARNPDAAAALLHARIPFTALSKTTLARSPCVLSRLLCKENT